MKGAIMATIEVKGTATRIFYEGKGVEVTEFFKGRDNELRKKVYTAWFEKPVEFAVNSEGVFRGLLSTVIDDWKDKEGNPVISTLTGEPGQSVKVSINGTTFTPSGDKAAVPPTWEQIPAADAPF